MCCFFFLRVFLDVFPCKVIDKLLIFVFFWEYWGNTSILVFVKIFGKTCIFVCIFLWTWKLVAFFECKSWMCGSKPFHGSWEFMGTLPQCQTPLGEMRACHGTIWGWWLMTSWFPWMVLHMQQVGYMDAFCLWAHQTAECSRHFALVRHFWFGSSCLGVVANIQVSNEQKPWLLSVYRGWKNYYPVIWGLFS